MRQSKLGRHSAARFRCAAALRGRFGCVACAGLESMLKRCGRPSQQQLMRVYIAACFRANGCPCAGSKNAASALQCVRTGLPWTSCESRTSRRLRMVLAVDSNMAPTFASSSWPVDGGQSRPNCPTPQLEILLAGQPTRSPSLLMIA